MVSESTPELEGLRDFITRANEENLDRLTAVLGEAQADRPS